MAMQAMVWGLFKATLLGVAVALLTCLGFLAYMRWGQGLPVAIRMLVLATGGAVFLTFTTAILFIAQTGISMRQMPLRRTYRRCFVLLILMLALEIVINMAF